jgi:hypothetical protein
MPRKIDDLMEDQWPPIEQGKTSCRVEAICIEAKLATAKNERKTPFVRLHWQTTNGEYKFTDDAFCTVKSIRRLALIASHVCGFADEIPDSDEEAMKVLEEFILENIEGKNSFVTIEEKQEIFIPESGPNTGRKTTVTKKKVAYNGYEKPGEVGTIPASAPAPVVEKKVLKEGEKEDDLPF